MGGYVNFKLIQSARGASRLIGMEGGGVVTLPLINYPIGAIFQNPTISSNL